MKDEQQALLGTFWNVKEFVLLVIGFKEQSFINETNRSVGVRKEICPVLLRFHKGNNAICIIEPKISFSEWERHHLNTRWKRL